MNAVISIKMNSAKVIENFVLVISSPVKASFFLICGVDSTGTGYDLRVIPRPAILILHV